MIEAKDIRKSYRAAGISWKGQRKEVLKGVTMEIHEGDCVGLIGESGSGKSTLARIILGLEKPDSGEVLIDGEPVTKWCRNHPGKMSVVFQDYTSSANPRYTVEQIIKESMIAGRMQADLDVSVKELMEAAGLPENLLTRYPHELSGGQLQRVCIARAVSTNPKFIVLDEALSSLDVSIQAQILKLLSDLQKKYHMTYLFIAHDLQAVTSLCDDIYFLFRGNIVEHRKREELAEAQNDYARTLLASVIPFEV